MPLTQNQFKAAYALKRRPGATQREVADECGLGLATVNAALRELAKAGLASEGRSRPRAWRRFAPTRWTTP